MAAREKGRARSPAPSHGAADLQRLLVESVSDCALFLIDPLGHVASWNPGATRMFGLTEAAAIGRSYSSLFTEEDLVTETPEALLKRAQTDGHCDWEGWRIGDGGRRLWVVASLSAVKDEAGELVGYSELSRDTIAREGDVFSVLESERHFRRLLDAVLDYAIYMLDRNGLVVNWNAGAERLEGYKPDEIRGKHFSIFYTKEDCASGVPATMLQAAARDGRYEGEHVRVRKDGSHYWANVVVDPIHSEQGELIGYAKSTRDISERRATQDALSESERQLRLLIEGVIDYAIYMIDPNGIVTNWNAGAQRIKGYAPNEIIGQHFSLFYTEEDRAAGKPLRSIQAASEHGRFESEGWRVRKDGSRFWASVVLDAIRDPSGKLIGFAKVTRDITDKRDAQIALQRAHEQLSQAQKMEALGQLTGGIAHDFNNLLMVVSGQAALMKRRVSEARDVRALESIEYAVSLGARLTRQLLSFGQRQPLNPVTIDLGEQVSTYRDLLASSARGNLTLNFAIGPGIWPVFADPSELELALVNLTVNARDAMPKGGTITLSAENRTIAASEELGMIGDFVAISVRDTGTGISREDLPRIFEPFFTTKPQGKGTGLGLAQVYGFAHRSGGSVHATSKENVGTVVTLYLPRSREPEQAERHTPPERAEKVSGRILVVEDNAEVRAVSTTLLEQMGYEVLFAESAAAALEVLARDSRIDLVFSDIIMPGEMDGLELARTIGKRYPHIAVLLTSGYARAAETAEREFPILRKPYEVKALAAAIAATISKARAV
ncbi:MAG: PAS domain S-box protein [Alphaproteobacteria bacterium]|nr:PAS domain S-box protein [Alphaproteobacteria bacterium]